MQSAERKKLLEQFQNQMHAVINQGEAEMEKMRDSEEKLQGMSELEESHVEQYSAVHSELRKEMAILQKKILMDIQQQEMMNVRKQLKTLLP
ncbi:unnamed protein product [Larinioides sclopetarius]|uniref:Uncharacterized protein n=1 Tax=Larinioides sclopetarius TaxID=280406 RepID=A0AAV2AC49_9ARAC